MDNVRVIIQIFDEDSEDKRHLVIDKKLMCESKFILMGDLTSRLLKEFVKKDN